jgi:hypothetical protein
MWDNENPLIFQNMGGDPDGAKTSLLFDTSKRELFTPNSGFKTLHRRLRSTWKTVTHRDEKITFDKIAQARVVIFGGPREKFTSTEVRNLWNSSLCQVSRMPKINWLQTCT